MPWADPVRFEADRITTPNAEPLEFVQPLTYRRVYAASDQEITFGYASAPDSFSRLRVSLLAPGFTAYAEGKVLLKVRSIGAPYLTWTEGSVRENVPSPAVRWLAISFTGTSPSYLLGFPTAPCAAKVTGKPGNWQIEIGTQKSWVRVGRISPVRAATTAALLGQVKQIASRNSWLYLQMPPKLLSVTATADQNTVTGTWTFDRAGAILPMPLYLAPLDGLRAKVIGNTERLEARDEGPSEVLLGKTLTVQFPSKRIATGRPVGIGRPTTTPLATISSLDIASVAELALETLAASRELELVSAAEQAYADYLGRCQFTQDPVFNLQLPYAETGQGADLAAVHALLSQVLVSVKRSGSDQNSLLTSVGWGMDWRTWQFWSSDPALSRRVGALAAITGAFCSEPERRLIAAMFEFGLSADRGRLHWQHRRKANPRPERIVPPLNDPLWPIRKTVYGYANLFGPPDPPEPFVQFLRSPLRLYAERPVTVLRDESGLSAVWSASEVSSSTMLLASLAPPTFRAKANLAKISGNTALGITEVRYTPESAGEIQAALSWPDWAPQLPAWAPAPTYSEQPRALDLR